MLRRSFLTLAIAILASPLPAHATSTFAREYGFSCERCHTIIPALNVFGQNFKSNGYRIAGKVPANTIPLSSSLLTTHENAGENGRAQVHVDEWRMQSGGALGSAVTYYIEQYLVDGGAPGDLDQAWLQYDSNTAHPTAKTDVRVRVGRQYLPLPVYADTYRPTLNPYGIFEQAAGENPFALGNEYTGVDLGIGSDYDAAGLHAFVSRSHAGVFVHQNLGSVNVSAYRVGGHSNVGQTSDTFWRQGIVGKVTGERLEWTGALQFGRDSGPYGTGTSASSSGGFAQVQWSATSGMMAVARFDETFDDNAAERSLTASIVLRLTMNSRLTLEDVVHDGKHSVQSGLLVGF